MYQRNLEAELVASLADTPVVLLNGARQTGKSTLAGRLASDPVGGYVTLDDATTFAAAVADPQGFVFGLGERVWQAPRCLVFLLCYGSLAEGRSRLGQH